MAQVSNQTELQAALNARESSIQVTDNFVISSQISILYAVTIESLTAAALFTLTKDGSYSGYLFRVISGGALSLQNIIVDGNKGAHPVDDQDNRSLIFVTGGSLNLSSGTVLKDNNSYLEGGGIYLNSINSDANTLAINGNAQITGCYARTNGGGIMIAAAKVQDTFTIGGETKIDGNMAANGGGIYFRGYAEDLGYAFSIGEEVHISNNSANSTGGGIWFSGYRDGSAPASTLALSGNPLLLGNQATHGAGIYFYAVNRDDRLAIEGDAVITKNRAIQNGGGCSVQTNGVPFHVSINNASITDNNAGTGGAAYLLTDSGGTVEITGSIISGNKASNGESGTGGGIWIKDQSQDAEVSAIFADITLENNQASAQGGGIALYGGMGIFTFQMSGGTVTGNQASRDGGGLLFGNDGTGTLTFDQTVITGNTADGSGGGIYYANTGNGKTSTLTLNEAVISNNTAGVQGGGLRVTSGNGILTTVLTDCTVDSNIAQSNSGGGIWNGGNNDYLTLNGTTAVTGNKTKSGNGGGIYFNSDNGTVLLTGDVKITGNQADEVSTDFGNHGGGICLVPGILTIQEHVEISSNSAGKYGGGISAAENSQIIMRGGSIQDNSSGEYGGGIWIHGGSTVSLIGGAIAGNKAESGGGIYNGAVIYMEGSRDITDGIYIENEPAAIRLTNALTQTSAIQLENSYYVTPNEAGTPIIVGVATASYPQLTQSDADALKKPIQGFDGWEIKLNADNTQILLAPVIYQITYENLMGADNINPVAYTVTTPEIKLLPPENIAGYRFTGWFNAPSGGDQITAIRQGSIGDITLYARWEDITEVYTITFCSNDNCFSRANNIPYPINVWGGQDAKLSDVIPGRNRYCFCNWNTDRCGRGESYLPGDTVFSLTKDLHLYAIWKKNRCGCPCPSPKTGA